MKQKLEVEMNLSLEIEGISTIPIHHLLCWNKNKNLVYLVQLNFTIATIVKQIEGLLELWNQNKESKQINIHRNFNRNCQTNISLLLITLGFLGALHVTFFTSQKWMNNNLYGIEIVNMWATFNRIKNAFSRWIVHIHDRNWSLSTDSAVFLCTMSEVLVVWIMYAHVMLLVCCLFVCFFLSIYPPQKDIQMLRLRHNNLKWLGCSKV